MLLIFIFIFVFYFNFHFANDVNFHFQQDFTLCSIFNSREKRTCIRSLEITRLYFSYQCHHNCLFVDISLFLLYLQTIKNFCHNTSPSGPNCFTGVLHLNFPAKSVFVFVSRNSCSECIIQAETAVPMMIQRRSKTHSTSLCQYDLICPDSKL